MNMEDGLICLQPRELETEKCWSDVPPELLSLIISNTFLLDRRNFKLVCKSWNFISPLPQQLPPPVDSPYFDSPCFIFPQRSNNAWKLFHSLYNDFYKLDFQKVMGSRIRFSKYGWLLMSRDECTLFFFNPFTKQKIDLPSTDSSFLSVCFTSPPTSSDCSVFGIFSSSLIDDIEFGLIKVGDIEWKSKWLRNTEGHFWVTCYPLFRNGMYYCLDNKSRTIFVFDPTKKDHWQWRRYGKCSEIDDYDVDYDNDNDDGNDYDNDDGNDYDYDYDYDGDGDGDGDGEYEYEEEEEDDADDEEEEEEDDDDDDDDDDEEEEEVHENYMVEVDGDILGIFITNNDRRVSVKRLDSSEMRWIELESLGNKCLYVSNNGSFAETCTKNCMANTIYFNMFHGKSGVLYSLTSKMYHSVVGGFDSKQDYGLTNVGFGTWLKPTT